ncbi:MAG: hypothetical protein A2W90_10240 [Bacteroidetes bacterium GWF2_42_66]|nr:MAG: hypothetical protein A2W89_02275 [Bacteroidetes bacterium GWE2_42_39]OFY43288.1 MAG: hypothetical protein A2W90_10240 [Bacteroidetes bacterium GWF2_42_66]HBL77529.1 nucleotidyl transferase [Prolixibacteraceae bacterium]HCR89291.1 nucleotidyl transferase [Prolixibacteraceae bacterium]HCU61688.1 nucleotidyl transferase [Prolixibacteraceae bacterium]
MGKYPNYAVLMAAGNGQRMKELTVNIPKALVDVKGIPLLSYSLTQLDQKIDSISITVGHKKNELIKFLASNQKYQIIDTSYKGNSWWVFNSSLKYINEPVLVLTCDIITFLDIPFIFSNYINIGSPPCMIVPVRPVSGIDGDYIKEKDRMVLSLSRTKRTSIYCSGIQIINPYIINKHIAKHEDFNQIWSVLIDKNMLYVSDLYPHPWFSINTKEQLVKYLEKQNSYTP